MSRPMVGPEQETVPQPESGPPSNAAQQAWATGEAYVPPRLERLGGWQAVTLQQSIPIFP